MIGLAGEGMVSVCIAQKPPSFIFPIVISLIKGVVIGRVGEKIALLGI